MQWFSEMFRWRRRSTEERELSEELQFHFDMQVEKLRERGMGEQEARVTARKDLGSLMAAAESTRDTRRFTWVESWWRDLAHGHRLIRRNLGFSAVALIVVAAGVASNTLVFSVFKNLVLDPPPVKDPERVVVLSGKHPASNSKGALSFPDIEDLARRSKLVESIGAYQAFAMSSSTVAGSEGAQTVGTTVVSGSYFKTMGVAPLLGRFIEPSDDQEGHERVAVVTESFWRSQLGGREEALGETIRLNGTLYQLIGVMPASFRFPVEEQDVWLPLSSLAQDAVPWRLRVVRWMNAVARLKPNVSNEQATAELSGIAAGLAKEFPDTNRENTAIALERFQDHLTGDNRQPLAILFVAVMILMLLATVNLSSLLLGKALARRQEFAARAALGAGRVRVFRQFVLENGVLCFYGGILGVACAYAAFAGLRANPLPGLEQLSRAHWDIGMAGFVLILLLALPVAIAVLPAIQSTSGSLNTQLGAAFGRSSVSGAGVRTQRALAVGQVSLAVVLCVAFALLLRSLNALLSVDPGFQKDHILVVQFALPSWKYEGSSYLGALEQMIEKVRTIQGVREAATIKKAPFTGMDEDIALHPPGYEKGGQIPGARLHPVSPGYFSTMQIPLLEGRDFSSADRRGTPFAVIVNEAYIRRYAPGERLLGKDLRTGRDGDGPAVRVVGIARDSRFGRLDEEAQPCAYVPVYQIPRIHIAMMIRTETEPLALANSVRDAIQSVDREQAFEEISTMDAILSRASFRPRLLTAAAGLFAGAGVVLAALGVYMVISFLLARRTRELGIRAALGASQSGVAALVFRSTLLTAITGIATGIALSVLVGLEIRSQLFAVSAFDPVAYGAAAVLLLSVCLAAAIRPILRAQHLDPAKILREQ